ncbi:MAG: hypothetical protein ACLSVD_16510 [Eggerthellaceae bacterium]
MKAVVCVNDEYVCGRWEALPESPSIENRIIVAGERDGWAALRRADRGRVRRVRAPDGRKNVLSRFIVYHDPAPGLAKAVCHNATTSSPRYWQQVEEDTLHMSVTDSGWAKFGWARSAASGSPAPPSSPTTWTSSCPRSCCRRSRITG